MDAMTFEILTSRISVFEIEVDLGHLAPEHTREIPTFVGALVSVLPTLKTHHCITGQSGGFVQEMRNGTDFAHVLEHVIVELEHLADPDGRIYRGWTRKKLESAPSGKIYVIHYEAKDFLTGRLAAILGMEIVKDLIAGRPVEMESIIRDMKNPVSFFRKRTSERPQAPVADIEILWETAKVAYQEAEPPTRTIDLPIRPVLSGISERDKQNVRESVRHLRPHLSEVHADWMNQFLEFAGNYAEFIQAPIEALGLAALLKSFEGDQLEQYNQTAVRAGRQLAQDEVPFSLVLHAVHLYEESLLSQLMEVFPDKQHLHKVLVSLDNLFHNHLLTISLAYFHQLHEERSERKDSSLAEKASEQIP